MGVSGASVFHKHILFSFFIPIKTTDDSQNVEAKEYEHIKDSTEHYDAQTLDTATMDQQEQQGQINTENEDKDSDVDGTETMEDKPENDIEVS